MSSLVLHTVNSGAIPPSLHAAQSGKRLFSEHSEASKNSENVLSYIIISPLVMVGEGRGLNCLKDDNNIVITIKRMRKQLQQEEKYVRVSEG